MVVVWQKEGGLRRGIFNDIISSKTMI